VIRCDTILDNVHNDGFRIRHPDSLREQDEFEFSWTESHRRFIRKRSRAGRELGVLLPLGSRLRDGDVLFVDNSLILIARLTAAQVLVVADLNPHALAELAYELGNQHWPIEIRDDHSLVLPDDDVLRSWLRRRGINGEPKLALFKPIWVTPPTSW
jgi:urease accessory protein